MLLQDGKPIARSPVGHSLMHPSADTQGLKKLWLLCMVWSVSISTPTDVSYIQVQTDHKPLFFASHCSRLSIDCKGYFCGYSSILWRQLTREARTWCWPTSYPDPTCSRLPHHVTTSATSCKCNPRDRAHQRDRLPLYYKSKATGDTPRDG